MADEKAIARKKLLETRNRLPSCAISKEALSDFKEFTDSKTVFCYVSVGSEVETHSFIKEILSEKRVVVPRCTDSHGNMIAVEIKSFNELKEGFFGILEPVSAVEFPKERIDFAIVPGIAFDKNGYRLGYGKGYYDRFLYGISPFKLGVCKKELLAESLPHDEYDVKMDMVIAL